MSSQQLKRSDGTGESRLLSNVAAGWVANVVTLVIGFIMPRLIYESIGAVALGIWDLGWSLLNYVALSGLGASAATTHYVARFTAAGKPDEVRCTTASAFTLQLVMAGLAAAAFLLLLETLPLWVPGVADDGIEIGLLGVLLAATIAVALLGDLNQGILNGCHRGAVNELLVTAADIVLAVAMVIAVVAGYGIVGLAAVTLVTRIGLELIRFIIARRVCPEAAIRPAYWQLQRMRELIAFSTKSSIGIVQDILVHQVARLALMASAGPVALACYSRYATLVRQITRSIDRLTYVVPPMTSGLLGLGEGSRIADFSRQAGRATAMVTLPAALAFGVFGDEIVAVWMGPEFVVPGIAWVLAILAFAQSDRTVAGRVLSGMNAHGRIALVCLVSTSLVFVALLGLLSPLAPLQTAWLIMLSLLVGAYLPHLLLASRRIGLRPLSYLRGVYARAGVCNLVFLAGLLLAERALHGGSPILAGSLLISSVAILGLLYWFLALDARARSRIRTVLSSG